MPRVIALLALCALAGCEKTRDVYEITVALESNSCGSNAPLLEDGLRYRAQLQPEPPRASWKVLPKGAPIDGTFDEDEGAFRFRVVQTLNLDGIDAGPGQLACTVLREEILEGTLREDAADAGADAASASTVDDDPPLTGEHRIGFSADSNGSCRGVSGPLGPFDRLPCEARYKVTGEPKPAR
jgi:hypothetical protein